MEMSLFYIWEVNIAKTREAESDKKKSGSSNWIYKNYKIYKN